MHPHTSRISATVLGAIALVLLMPSTAFGASFASLPHAVVAEPGRSSSTGIAPGWTMFHGDPQLDGDYSGAFPWAHFKVAWQENFSGLSYPATGSTLSPLQSSPILSGGSLYAVTSNGAEVLVLNSTSGALTQTLPLTVPGQPTAVVAGTPLLSIWQGVAFLAVTTEGGDITILNLTSGGVWSCSGGAAQISSSPTPVPGGFFVSAYNGNVWYIPWSSYTPLTGGPLPACPAKWGGSSKYEATASYGWPNVPGGAPAGPYVFYTDNGNNKVDAYSVTTPGNPQWSYTVGGRPPLASVALVNLTQPVPGAAPFGFLGIWAAAGSAAGLDVLNLSEPAGNAGIPFAAYSFPTNATVTSGINSTVALRLLNASAVEAVYATVNGTLSGVEFSLAPSGTGGSWSSGWNLSTSAGFAASPVIVGGLAMDADTHGTFYAVNAATGQPVWEKAFPATFFASPVVSGTDVYLLSTAGTLYDLRAAPVPISLQVPATVVGGTTVPVLLHLNALGVTGQTLPWPSGTPAFFGVAASGGKWVGPTSGTWSGGVGFFNWTAPIANMAENYTLFGAAGASGYALNATSAGTSVPASALPLMTLRVLPASSQLNPGEATVVSFNLANASGQGVRGATLSLVPPSGGSWNVTTVTTGTNGNASANFTAPTTGGTQAILLQADAVSAGYQNASGTAAVSVSYLETLRLSVTGPPNVLSGENATLWLSGSIVSTVTGQVLSTAGGAVVSPSVSAGAVLSICGAVTLASNGTGNCTLEPSLVSGAQPLTLTFSATFPGVLPDSATMSMTVEPRPLSVEVIVPSSPVVPASGGSLTVSANSGGKPVAGAWVNVTEVSAGLTSNLPSVQTDANGVAVVPFVAVNSSGTLMSFYVGVDRPGYVPYANTTAVYVASSASTNGSGPNALSWALAILLVVAVLLLLGILLVLLLRRRGGPVPKGPASGSRSDLPPKADRTPAREESSPSPMVIAREPGPSSGPSTVPEVPAPSEAEWREEESSEPESSSASSTVPPPLPASPPPTPDTPPDAVVYPAPESGAVPLDMPPSSPGTPAEDLPSTGSPERASTVTATDKNVSKPVRKKRRTRGE